MKRYSALIIVSVFLSVFAFIQGTEPVNAVASNDSALLNERPVLVTQADRPLYDPRGKRDPFKPFIRAPREERVEITEATPPIKKYSLDRYRITGIVWVGNEPKAVIVDPERNTYFLGRGDEIGNRNGEIVEVRETGILVEERRYFEDVFGNRKVEVTNSVLAFAQEDR